MLFTVNILILCYLSVHGTSGFYIDCKTENCRHTAIDCLPNEDCFVQCDEKEACYGGVITCPINGDCGILCSGGEACRDTTINATFSSGNFNLKCLESVDHCKGIKIHGSIISNNNNYDFNVSCDGKRRACTHSQIECASHSNCFISCESDESCRWSKVAGPTNGDLTVNCDDEKACFDAIFNASHSSKLNINGCTADKSCLDLTFYCPPNTNGHKNCFIQGNNNIGRDNAAGTLIYAINGWDDVEIDYYGTFSTFHDGKMFCGDHYQTSCNIVKDAWSCNPSYNYEEELEDDELSDCNSNTAHFEDDEINASTIPTQQPSTSNLETISPSIYPTIYPSKYPSKYPTIYPTMQPITKSPTITPTYYRIIHEMQSTDPSFITMSHDSNVDNTISWTTELLLGFGVFVCVMLFMLGMYCCCVRNKKKLKPDTQSKSESSQTATLSSTPKPAAKPAKSKCLLDYKPIDIEFADDMKLKARPIETTQTSSIRSIEGMLDPYSPHANAIKSRRSSSPSPPNSSHIVHSDTDESSNFLQMELKLRGAIHKKMAICRKVSNYSNITNFSNACTASSDDDIDKNILFLDRQPQSVRIQMHRGNINRKNTVSQSSETSVSIQTNSDETSVGSKSDDMFVSPIKPRVSRVTFIV